VVAEPNINQKKAPVFPNTKPLKVPGTTADPLRIKKIKKKMRVSPTPSNEDASRDSDDKKFNSDFERRQRVSYSPAKMTRPKKNKLPDSDFVCFY
jgi:hypothetical protein